MRERNVVSTISERRPHPIPALTDRRIWQANGMKVVFVTLNAGNINLDFNDAGINAIDGGAESLVEHGCSFGQLS